MPQLSQEEMEQPIAPRPVLSRINNNHYCSRHITRNELIKSVQEELSRLLNTVNLHAGHIAYDKKLTLVDYGITSFTERDAHNTSHQDWLRKAIIRAIETFEPRLDEVAITLNSNPDVPDQLLINIKAVLKSGEFREDFRFQLAV